MTDDLDALADDLAEFEAPEKIEKRNPVEERVIAGFEDIQRFYKTHGRAPRHGEDRDIFERIYAVRLARLAQSADYRSLLQPLDHQGLLECETDDDDDIDLDDLAADLDGIEEVGGGITALKHVRSSQEIRAAEEIANREKCQDFDRFKPLFKQVQSDVDLGVRKTQRFRKGAGFAKTDFKKDQFFILGGQTGLIADVLEDLRAPNGEHDARLRVIFANGTESNLLLRSLIRAMYNDEVSRLVSEPAAGPLFSSNADETDTESGTIYVLRSLSDHPFVAENRDLLHKIGVTGGSVESRIANAKLEPTYLMADVEVVATYKLYNINRKKLENLIHRIFEPAKLDVSIPDRFGNSVVPREWFLVPLFSINDAVEKIRQGDIDRWVYDKHEARLVEA